MSGDDSWNSADARQLVAFFDDGVKYRPDGISEA
jgi:hypothetical protein